MTIALDYIPQTTIHAPLARPASADWFWHFSLRLEFRQILCSRSIHL
jgi:hypothetical protein